MSALVLLETTARHVRSARAIGLMALRNAFFEARHCTGGPVHRREAARTFFSLARDAYAQAARAVLDERRRLQGLANLRFN